MKVNRNPGRLQRCHECELVRATGGEISREESLEAGAEGETIAAAAAVAFRRGQARVVVYHFRITRSIEFVGAVAGHANGSEGEDDCSRRVNFDDLVIELITDEDVAGFPQSDGVRW